MEYSNQIVINLDRQTVFNLLTDVEVMKKWSPSLIGVEIVEGKPHTKGTKQILKFDAEEDEIVMEEIILDIKVPELYYSLYTSQGAKNWSKNEFTSLSENQTQWDAYNKFEFTINVKNRESIMEKQFSEQTQQDMESFKEFAESYKSKS